MSDVIYEFRGSTAWVYP